jgi:protocatechuate 3,4-dioxygenase beta subunit
MTDRKHFGAAPRLLLSRRQFAQAGIAAAGLGWGAGAHALQDREPTAASPMGPFYPVAQPAENDADLTRLAGRTGRAAGNVIELTGRILDRRGNPIQDAAIELWQANAAGRYAHPADPATAPLDADFQGYAMLRTDASGAFRFVTIKPGGYDSPIGHRPPHLHFDLRGRASRTVAQMYFPEDATGNAADTLYRGLGDGARTSVAVRDARDPSKYSWDVIMFEA